MKPAGRAIFMPKKRGETIAFPFDFASSLGEGETLSTATLTASVYSGVDASPSSIRSGSPSISGSVVTQKIYLGEVGVIYELLCRATTSASQVLQMSAYLAVEEDLP